MKTKINKKSIKLTASSALIYGLLSAFSISTAQAAGLPINITSPANGSSSSATSQTITGTTAPGASVSLSIDGGSAVIIPADGSGNWSYVATGLSNGSHSFSASVVGGSYAYVPNNGICSGWSCISVIDVNTDTVTKSLPSGGNLTSGVAVSPVNTGSQDVYVSAADKVVDLNPVTDNVTARLDGGASPRGIAYSPAGSTAYVANFGLNGQSTVSVFNPSVTPIYGGIIGDQSWGVAMNSAGTKVYVANYNGGTVSVLDKSGKPITSIQVGSNPVGVAADPFSSKIYVTNAGSNTVAVIDSVTDSVTAWIGVGSYPIGVVFSPTAPLAFVANGGSNDVYEINTNIDTPNGTIISVGSNPYGIDITPDGSKVYVTNAFSSDISVIDTLSGTVTKTINLPGAPYAIGRFITPAVRNTYAMSMAINTNSGNNSGGGGSTNSGSYLVSTNDNGNANSDQQSANASNQGNQRGSENNNGEVKSANTSSKGLIGDVLDGVSKHWPWLLLIPLAALAIPFFWILAKRRKKEEDKK